MQKKLMGAVGQLRVAHAYQQLGYNVLLPFGDLQRYDLVVEKNQSFSRVQVKTVTSRDGFMYVDARVIGHNRTKINIYKPTRSDFDILAVVENATQTVYAIPFDGSQLQFTLRTKAAKNNQSKNIRNADDYLLTGL